MLTINFKNTWKNYQILKGYPMPPLVLMGYHTPQPTHCADPKWLYNWLHFPVVLLLQYEHQNYLQIDYHLWYLFLHLIPHLLLHGRLLHLQICIQVWGCIQEMMNHHYNWCWLKKPGECFWIFLPFGLHIYIKNCIYCLVFSTFNGHAQIRVLRKISTVS